MYHLQGLPCCQRLQRKQPSVGDVFIVHCDGVVDSCIYRHYSQHVHHCIIRTYFLSFYVADPGTEEGKQVRWSQVVQDMFDVILASSVGLGFDEWTLKAKI